MTAYRTISLTMMAVFIVIYLLGSALYIQQARYDVERELTGVSALAESLGSPESLSPSVVGNLRHMRPVTGVDDTAGKVPSWFSGIISGSVSFPPVNGWRVDPAD